MEAHVKIWYEGKVNTKIYRALRSGKENWTVAYQLALPPFLTKIHDVFHDSMLWKAKIDPSSATIGSYRD